jgi:hypothetical protein
MAILFVAHSPELVDGHAFVSATLVMRTPNYVRGAYNIALALSGVILRRDNLRSITLITAPTLLAIVQSRPEVTLQWLTPLNGGEYCKILNTCES